MKKRQIIFSEGIFLVLGLLFSCSITGNKTSSEEELTVCSDSLMEFVKSKALDIVKTGFNAGDGYGEVWIRDYNTFLELSTEVFSTETLKENLLVFFRMQGDDGNIIDGYIP
jgi:hypothetical protein